MHAVIVDVSINELAAARRELTERIIPMASQAPGFVAGYWLAAGEDKGHSIVVFESEQDAQAVADGVRANPRSAVTMDRVEVAEVVASA
ncbi:MAG: hypothetical protein ACJ764_15725 [Solirubrobacteraceae bacterium]